MYAQNRANWLQTLLDQHRKVIQVVPAARQPAAPAAQWGRRWAPPEGGSSAGSARPFLRVIRGLSLRKFKWRMLGESFRIESVNVYRRSRVTTESQAGPCSGQNPHPYTEYGRLPCRSARSRRESSASRCSHCPTSGKVIGIRSRLNTDRLNNGVCVGVRNLMGHVGGHIVPPQPS